MSELHWEDPPPRPARRRWADIADEMRARPGAWTWVMTAGSGNSARVIAARINRGAHSLGPGPWEATRYAVGDEHRVYARYTGGGGDE